MPKENHLTGCVEKGTEPGCLLLNEMESGKHYQLLVRGPRPQPSDAIEITGAPFHGVTSCMQGQPVSVTNWSHTEMPQCAQQESRPR